MNFFQKRCSFNVSLAAKTLDLDAASFGWFQQNTQQISGDSIVLLLRLIDQRYNFILKKFIFFQFFEEMNALYKLWPLPLSVRIMCITKTKVDWKKCGATNMNL